MSLTTSSGCTVTSCGGQRLRYQCTRQHPLLCTLVPRRSVLGSAPLVFPNPSYTVSVTLGREPVAYSLYLLLKVRNDERHCPYLRLLSSPKTLLPWIRMLNAFQRIAVCLGGRVAPSEQALRAGVV